MNPFRWIIKTDTGVDPLEMAQGNERIPTWCFVLLGIVTLIVVSGLTVLIVLKEMKG